MVEGLSTCDTEKLTLSLSLPFSRMQPSKRLLCVGGFGGGGTPGPFSNPVVKPTRADGTWGVGPWESRSSPTLTSLFVRLSPAIVQFVLNPQNDLKTPVKNPIDVLSSPMFNRVETRFDR